MGSDTLVVSRIGVTISQTRKQTSSARASSLLEAWKHTLARWVPPLAGPHPFRMAAHMSTSSHSTITVCVFFEGPRTNTVGSPILVGERDH